MLSGVEWGEYRIGDLFEKVKTNSLRYKAKDFPSHPTEECNLPALTAGIINQGLNTYIPADDGTTILQNVISISANGANTGATFYQPKPFAVLQDAYAIRWIDQKKELEPNTYLFLASAISSVVYGKYEWTNKAGWARVQNDLIQLPTRDGKIDFMFMERFVAELKAQRVAELKAYLAVTGLSDYTLTPEEQQAIQVFQEGKLQWRDYRIAELFEVLSYKKRFDANKVTLLSSGHPYIVRTSANNGCKGYLQEDEAYLNEGNTLSFGQDTATVFYQERPYFTGDKIKVLKCKDGRFKKEIALFFIATIDRAFSSFSWGSTSFSEKAIKGQQLSLPIANIKIDYNYMETFIRAIEKLVIRDVVLYADRELAATEQVINQ